MPERIDTSKYKNVFDNEEEFNRLNDLIIEAIQKFSDYRNGNLTYGEIMYVLESILDSMRESSEKDTKKQRIKGLNEPVSFSSLMSITSRMLETMLNKGSLSSEEHQFILKG